MPLQIVSLKEYSDEKKRRILNHIFLIYDLSNRDSIMTDDWVGNATTENSNVSFFRNIQKAITVSKWKFQKHWINWMNVVRRLPFYSSIFESLVFARAVVRYVYLSTFSYLYSFSIVYVVWCSFLFHVHVLRIFLAHYLKCNTCSRTLILVTSDKINMIVTLIFFYFHFQNWQKRRKKNCVCVTFKIECAYLLCCIMVCLYLFCDLDFLKSHWQIEPKK